MITIDDIKSARPNVYKYINPTPLYHYSGLSDLVGTEVWVKHENHLPVGAFKVRGGLNLTASLSEEEKKAGLYTASSGNHGQSIAYASRANKIKATIAVPEGANPEKVALMKGLGAEVLTHGAGSGVCGTAITANSLNPDVKVIGVQSELAPTMQLSWKSGEPLSGEMHTSVEGIATRVSFENTQQIMRKYLSDFLLVSDDSIYDALKLMIQHTHNLTEGAGAAPLAAALTMKEKLAGKKVVLIMSGGNVSLQRLKSVLGD